MELMKLPRTRPLSFGPRFKSPYSHLINRNFLLGRDPFEENKMAPDTPPVNVKKLKDHYSMEIPLPGYKKEEIAVTLGNNVLTIRGNKQLPEEHDSDYVLREHSIKSFRRSFELGPAAANTSITASLKDGILEIRLTPNGTTTTQTPLIKLTVE